MIIHLAGSPSQPKEDSPYLQTIAEVIRGNGDKLAFNWFEADGKLTARTFGKYIEALRKADLLIAEATHYDFDLGLFTALATHHKKPTLLLSRQQLEGRSVSGINNQYLTTHRYKTAKELKSIVADFLKENALDAQDQRFNFFIDRQIHNYLRDKSYETGKNKSEIIRELLDREINRRNN